MSITLASAIVHIAPSLQGAGKQIQAQLGGVNMKPVGKSMGDKISAGIGGSLKANVNAAIMAPVTTAMDRQASATSALTAAENNLAKARAGNQSAQAKVLQAEEKLEALRASGTASSGDLAKAEADLNQAKVALSDSNIRVSNSEEAATRAKEAATTASDNYTAALKNSESIGSRLQTTLAVTGDRMQAIGGQWKTAGSQISGVGTDISKKLTLPVVGATTAVGGLVAGLGFKRLVGIDTARGQFKGLGYDADAVMKQVDAGVTGTALSMADGASMAVGILATGAVPLEGLEAQIQRTANVAAAYGVEGSHAANLLNQVLTKNKVTYGDLSQMQANGIPIISQLADHYGVAGDEIEKMAREGTISIEDMNKVIDNNAGAAAEEYSKTWAGVTANIRSNLGRLGAELLGGVFPQLKSQAEGFLEVLKSDQAKAFAQQVGGALTDAFTSISGAIKGAFEWFTNLSPAMQKTILGVAGFAVAAGPVLIVVGKIATGIGALLTVGGAFVGVTSGLIAGFRGTALAANASRSALIAQSVATKLASGAQKVFNLVMKANPIGLIITAIGLLVAGLVWFFTQTELGQQLWAGFMGFLQDSWANIVSFFQTSLAVISAVWTTVWTGISTFFQGLWNGIVSFFTGIWNSITTAVNIGIAAVRAVINSVLNAIKNIWSNGWQWHMDLFMNIWEGIKSFGKTAIDWVKNAISNGVNAVRTVWSNVWSAISSFFSGVWNGIVSFAQSAIANVKARIQIGVNAVKAVWNSVWNGIKTFFSNVWQNIVSAAQGFIGSVKSTFQNALDFIRNIPNQVIGFFTGLGSRLIESGKSLISGFINGIKQGFSNAVGAVKEGLANVRNFFPFSPAKEGPFSGKGWVAYSGLSVGKTFSESVADALHDGRKDIADEMSGINDELNSIDEPTFSVGTAVPATASGAGFLGVDGLPGSAVDRLIAAIHEMADRPVEAVVGLSDVSQGLFSRTNRTGRSNGKVNLGGPTV